MTAEQLIDQYLEGFTNMGPGSERYPPIGAQSFERKKRRRWKDGKPELETFGLAGLPGGSRNDPESPNSYSTVPQTTSHG